MLKRNYDLNYNMPRVHKGPINNKLSNVHRLLARNTRTYGSVLLVASFTLEINQVSDS